MRVVKGWPEWANWKSIDKDGIVTFWDTKPIALTNCFVPAELGFTLNAESEEREILNQYQLDNWPNGVLTKRPQTKEEDFFGMDLIETEAMKKAKGVKADAGKPEFRLIPQVALLEVAKVMTFGAKKYAPDNWRKVENAHSRYIDAALRHINAHLIGQHKDPESDLSHLAHAVCSLMMAMEMQK